jgi:glycosyltransferase involved in cell wall biosynthesis
MRGSETIYLHVWNGDPQVARTSLRKNRPGAPVVELSHGELRAGGWRKQIHSLRSLRGRALMVYFDSLNDAPQLQLVLWSGLLHHCRETIVADASGEFRSYRRLDWLWLLPRTVISGFADGFVLLIFLLVPVWRVFARPVPFGRELADLDVAYLFPFPLIRDTAGGAMSHIRGVLGGIAANGRTCRVFAGNALPLKTFLVSKIPVRRRLFLFWETAMLSYSIRFAHAVRRMLKGSRPAMLYQRHGRFTIAGAILSQWIQVPLVLEYNASELWMARYWDPTRFVTWMRFCEEFALRCATLIVVVSEPIRDELLERGIPPERILVNPNAVDPDVFHPRCGGEQLRNELGIAPHEMVVSFVGTFGPWHGITVLQEGIRELLREQKARHSFRFLLVGNGSLHEQMRGSLRDLERARKVLFPGIVPHYKVPAYLDAADILVSPHVPMPDGRPFFGSPTKLFEYMAMGKAIVASNLDQLAQVLEHQHTALLVEPGNAKELANAIRLLEQDADLRRWLGVAARETAVARHTWEQNVARVLAIAYPTQRVEVRQQIVAGRSRGIN